MVPPENDLPSFGALLKRFRTRRYITQQQLAEAVSLHRHAIGRWERGDFLPTNKAIVLELARHLRLDEQETRHLLEASLTGLSPHWLVPFSRNPFFTGREEILEALHTQLGVDRAVALIQSSALHGLGGIGKTQIALEYAYRYALEYSAVFWIGAQTQESIVANLLRVASVLQLPERNEQDQQRVVAAVQRWLAANRQWLLIWDNVEDLALFEHFLPEARTGAILLTTRLQALGTLARGVDLLPMDLEEGRLFLLRRAKVLEPEATCEHVDQLARRLPSEYAVASELVTMMGGLPLALDQAGAYIEEIGCSLSDYLQRYQQQQVALLDRRGLLGSVYPHSVVTTFRLVNDQVERKQKAAADLLEVCTFLSAEAIPEELFLEGAAHLGPELAPLAADPFQFDHAMAILRSFSLIQRHLKTRTFSIHRLVQVVLQEQIGEQKRTRWLRRVIAALNATFPEVTYEAWKRCELLLPHVMACAAAIPDGAEHQALAEVLRKAADYLCGRAQYEQAEPFYQRARGILEQTQGTEHPALAQVLYRLAFLYGVQRKFQQAEPLYQEALCIQERVLGPLHPETAHSLHGLAALYREVGQYEQAEPLFQRALQVREHVLGPHHHEVALTLRGLATLYAEWGKYEQAEPLFQRALVLTEQALGPEHPDMLYALNGLAILSSMQGRYEQAEPFYQRALSLTEQTLGPEHPDVGYVLANQAECYTKQGRYEQAEILYRRVLSIWMRTLGPEHPMVAYVLAHQAECCAEQGRYEQAELLYQQALQIREQVQGPEHPETAQTLHDLALFYQKQGNVSEALSFAQRALRVFSQSLGDIHPKTIATRTLSIQLAQEQDGVDQEELAQRSAKAHQDHFGEEHISESASILPHDTTNAFPAEDDPLQRFLASCCELHPLAWCTIRDLWHAYEHWTATEQGRVPLPRRAFTAQLEARGCRVDRTSKARIWRGIRLVNKSL